MANLGVICSHHILFGLANWLVKGDNKVESEYLGRHHMIVRSIGFKKKTSFAN